VDQVDRGRRRGRGSSLGRITVAVLAVTGGLFVLNRSPRPAAAAVPGRVRLVRQTSWVAPGDSLSLILRTADVSDPAALELAVTVHQAVKTRAELARSALGEGLASPIWPRSSAAVPLPQVTAAADGTLAVQVPTQNPAAPRDPARFKLPRAGIYPVQVELREQGGGDTVDRFITYLLAVDAPSDGSRLGAAVVLQLSAPPSTGLDGIPTGPPAGASALADAATGLGVAPQVPLTVAPTPEVLESLMASDPDAAAALANGLNHRDVVARPYVPIDVPGLGAAGGSLLPQQMAIGREVDRAVLGKDPIDGIWLADEPLDEPALALVVAAGASRLVLPQGALGPTGPNVQAPLRPVTVAGGGVTATALVADDALSTHLDGRGAPLDQPLVAHQLLADLAAIATLPTDQAAPAPEPSPGRRVATVLAGRGFTPTSGFLAELMGGLAASPVLRAVDLATAFALSPEPPAVGTSMSGCIKPKLIRTESTYWMSPIVPSLTSWRIRRTAGV